MSRQHYIFRSILHIQSVSLAGSCRSKCLSTHPVTVLQTGAETCEWCVCKVDHTSQKWISVHLPEYKHVCVCVCVCGSGQPFLRVCLALCCFLTRPTLSVRDQWRDKRPTNTHIELLTSFFFLRPLGAADGFLSVWVNIYLCISGCQIHFLWGPHWETRIPLRARRLSLTAMV